MEISPLQKGAAFDPFKLSLNKTNSMKQLITCLLALALYSCDKMGCFSDSNSLDGNWKMISVKGNNDGSFLTKPSSVSGDVIIDIKTTSPTAGNLSGATPTNEIFNTGFSYSASGKISIPNLPMTKVAETTWGVEFVDNIRSADKYSLDDDHRLVIKTAVKTLTFQKQ